MPDMLPQAPAPTGTGMVPVTVDGPRMAFKVPGASEPAERRAGVS